MKLQCLLWLALAAGLSGCASYQYRVVQPPGVPQPSADQPVVIRYEPLEYRLERHNDRLAMRIINPTDDQIMLQANRSYVVDPQGESHPLRGRVIGPHSFAQMLLPPVPITYAYPDYSWGVGWGPYPWYEPFWGPYWGPGFVYGVPSVTYQHILTTFDWVWNTGMARLRLGYERAGKSFDHYFEIVREQSK